MRPQERVAQLAELAVQPRAERLLAPTLPHLEPGAFDRVDHEQVAHFLARSDRRIQPREVVLQLRVMRPPGRLRADRSRVVALDLALHRVPVQHLAAQVNPKGRLPIADRLQAGEGKVPAGAAIGLGKAPLAPELPRDGADLLGRVIVARSRRQQVHPRRLHVLVEPHRRRDQRNLSRESVLHQDVAGEEQVVACAPVADLFREGGHEEVRDAVEEMVARRPTRCALDIVAEFRQVRQQIVAVSLAEDFRQRVGPGERASLADSAAVDA